MGALLECGLLGGMMGEVVMIDGQWLVPLLLPGVDVGVVKRTR